MYVLGINGSPRIGGNSDILLDKVLEGAKNKGAKTEKVVLNNLKFSPCQECDEVRDDGSCIIDDDMQSLYKKIGEADALILASPIFFGSLSAQTKMMIDRFQCLWRAKYLFQPKADLSQRPTSLGLEPLTEKKGIFNKKKKGFFICVEASTRKDFFDNAKSIVKNFFVTVGANYRKELFCPAIDEKGSVLKHSNLLSKAFKLGERIVEGGR